MLESLDTFITVHCTRNHSTELQQSPPRITLLVASMGFDEKTQYVENEHIERRKSTSEEATELSGIESTATSSAAWLIALTVSIGGFLFGSFHLILLGASIG